MQVVIILVPPGEIALRTSSTTSGRYGWRNKHPDAECYGYVSQLTAVGNLTVVDLCVEVLTELLTVLNVVDVSKFGGCCFKNCCTILMNLYL